MKLAHTLGTLRPALLSTLVGLVSALAATEALAARHALLIGNDSYQAVPVLQNARADADAMSQALRKAGYQVVVAHDRTLKQMKDDVRQFKAKVRGGDEVVVFYSGHGVQIEGMNYLLPVDVRADSADQVKDDGLALSKLLDDLRAQKPAFTLAVVDACRDNPFTSTGRAIGGRGLTGVAGASGQMVIYSAGEGQQALDRLGDADPVRNGVFTRVFIKEMESPGVPIDQVARRVREQVNALAQSVKHEQVPAIYDQVIGQFFFYQPQAQVPAPSVKVAQNDPEAENVELLFWESVKDSRDVEELKAYLEKYPNGNFSGLAKARIRSIEQKSGTLAAQREAERIAAEKEKQRLAEEQAKVEAAQREAQRIAAEKEKQRLAEDQAKAEAAKREAERIAAEKEKQRLAEEQAKAEAAKREAERLAAEKEKARLAAEEKARQEAEQAKALAAKQEAERVAAEAEKARQAEQQAKAEAAKREAERIAAEQEKARLEAEKAKAAPPEEEPIF